MIKRSVICLITVFALTIGASSAHASSIEDCFTSKLNGARSAAGKAQLSTRGDLVAIARRHSERMAAAGEIFHNSNLRNEAPADWKTIGENVGRGPDCGGIHDAFMGSPLHKKNILDSTFTLIGVGVVVGADNTIFVTQVFMQSQGSAPPPSGTASPPRPRAPRAPPKPRIAPSPLPSPSPLPPPPPGSLVTGQTVAYLLILETEEFPTDEEAALYLRSKGSS